MNKVIVKTQREYDAAPKNKQTQIIILDAREPITVPTSAADKDILKIEVRGNSRVIAHADADLYCYDNSAIEAFDNTHIFAFDNSRVAARNHATVSASDNTAVEAWHHVAVFSANNARVKIHDFCDSMAKDNSTVWAEDHSMVNSYNTSSVYASGSAKILNAYDNCHIHLSGQAAAKAYDSSRVTASDASSVESYNKATVILRNNASVKAQDNSLVITDNKLKNISSRHKSVVFDASAVGPENFKENLIFLVQYPHFKNNSLLAASSLLSCLPQDRSEEIRRKLASLGAANSENMQALFQSWVQPEKNNGVHINTGQVKNNKGRNNGPEPGR
jgi:hypothetical protein